MKQCSNCGAELQDEIQFCMNCGAAVPAAEPAPMTEPEAVYAAPVEEAVIAQEAAPKKKGKGKLIALIAGGVALLAVIAFVIIGFATNWFRGPLGEIEVALEKMLKVNSFTVDVEISSKDSDGDDAGKSSMSYQIVLDRDKKDATILTDMENESGSYVAKSLQADGKSYTVIWLEDEVWSAACEDLPKDVYEDFFKALDGEYETDDEALEELLEKYDIKADADEFREFIKTLEKDCLGNQEWLEEFLGFEKKKDKYVFEIDMDDLTKDIAERAYEADIISKSQKKEWTAEKTKVTYEIEISLKDGYISEIEVLMEGQDGETSIILEFSDIDETEITDKEKNEIIDGYDEYIDLYCAYCKGCEMLDKKDYMRQANDDYYCDDCYYAREFCEDCYGFFLSEDLTTIDYYDLCADCHAEYIKEYYADCVDCKTNQRKNNMYLINEKYYCYDCRWNRDYCDDCSAFVKEDELTRVNYSDYCKDCYNNYKAAHTCDLCGYLTGSNYICYEHTITDYCGSCGTNRTLEYYNVQTKKHLCWWCY